MRVDEPRGPIESWREPASLPEVELQPCDGGAELHGAALRTQGATEQRSNGWSRCHAHPHPCEATLALVPAERATGKLDRGGVEEGRCGGRCVFVR